jgi:SAM-dependent methyltransferase
MTPVGVCVHEHLAAHYDAKYAGEPQSGRADQLVRTARTPRNRFEACVRSFPRVFRGGDVLELGAGSGNVAQSLLAGGLACRSYTASDTSQVRLEGLQRRLDDPRARVACIDAEQLPEALTGGFDAVIMVALIEHLVDPVGALAQIRRLLRPGGFVYLDTPNVAKWTRRLKLLAGRFPATSSRDEGLIGYDGEPLSLHDDGHLHYFTYRSLSRLLLERCGFASVERFPYAVGGSLPALLSDRLARLWPELFAEVCLVARA